MSQSIDLENALIETVVGFVAQTLSTTGVIFSFTKDEHKALFDLVRLAGFRVDGYRFSTAPEMENCARFFPRGPVLPITFSSKHQDEGSYAAGWLDAVIKAERRNATAAQPMGQEIREALERIRPVDPIQLTPAPLCDHLVFVVTRWLDRASSGFVFHHETARDESHLSYGQIGRHDACGGALNLHPARNGWGRVACEKCYMSVLVHVTDENTYFDLRADIQCRVLGLPPAATDDSVPQHQPYSSDGVRPSVEC